MIYNFRFDRDALVEILRRLCEGNFLSQGWGGGDNNLDISRLSKELFIRHCQEYYGLKSNTPRNLSKIYDFKNGDILVTPHLPEPGKVSLHIVEGDFPACYYYLEHDDSHLNHRIKIRKSYGIDGSISIDNFELALWRSKLQSLRLPILPIEKYESIFQKLIHRIEKEHATFDAPELKRLTLENFKAFKKCELTLAPLTILIGENSSGKSSLLQALLLLKQTLESPGGSGILNLNDHYVQFHTFREMVFGMPPFNEEAIVGFELGFQDNQQLKFEIGTQKGSHQLNLLTVHFNDEELLDKASSKLLEGNAILFSQLKNILQLSTNEVAKQLHETVIMPTLTEIGYLLPIRPLPQRYYHLRGTHPDWVGIEGKDMPDFLESHPSIKKRVRDWFVEKAQIAQEVNFKSETTRSEMEITFLEVKSGLEIDISRLGLGFSQILPIVVATFSQKKMLIFEAPEIHTNPKLHGVMTDLFIEGANQGKQVLVETHSEHLVYRVQRRIAEGQIAPDAVALYYVQRGEKGSIIERLTITEKGEIPDWPLGFFEAEMEDIYERVLAVSKG
jgi:predicted ATPase